MKYHLLLLVFVIGLNGGQGLFVKNLLDPIKFIIDTIVSISRFAQFFFRNELTDYTPSPGETFDFVVIGAGSAGAAVAARLSEVPQFRVLLIEAGGPESFAMGIPLSVNYFQFSDEINWKYKTEPSNGYCRGMENRQCNWPRGKVMGGSSVLNYMIAVRGRPENYDGWEQLGNPGWGYRDVEHYFKKLENMEIDGLKYDSVNHNQNGPVTIGYVPYRSPLAQAFVRGGTDLGLPYIDYNSPQGAIGVSFIQSTIRNGERVSTNKAYLHPIRDRPNLRASMNSQVVKIHVDPKTQDVYAVTFEKGGQLITVRNRKEVILSAGSIGSPQTLMLSGIGPEEHLRQVGVPVVRNLPGVGKNLQDHIAFGGLLFTVKSPVSILSLEMANLIKPHIWNYQFRRNGPITVPGGVEALMFLNSEEPWNRRAVPNIELMFIGSSIVGDPNIHRNFGISEGFWARQFKRLANKHSYMIFPMIMHPKSRGEILLRSGDYRDHPRIYPNYMSHPDDVRVLVEAIRAAIVVSNTTAMREFGAELVRSRVPGCEGFRYDSDEYWECALRTYTFNIYHYSGTCKMGPEEDPMAVVDHRLRVRGVKRLRVADASIMPLINTGHTNIPAIMIGEKCADMVKADWGKLTTKGRRHNFRYGKQRR